jgi:hypothetical protein
MDVQVASSEGEWLSSIFGKEPSWYQCEMTYEHAPQYVYSHIDSYESLVQIMTPCELVLLVQSEDLTTAKFSYWCIHR